jgi:hypothetical protein
MLVPVFSQIRSAISAFWSSGRPATWGVGGRSVLQGVQIGVAIDLSFLRCLTPIHRYRTSGSEREGGQRKQSPPGSKGLTYGPLAPLGRSTTAYNGGSALLAQLVEHLHGKEGVDGSSPSEGFEFSPA